MSQKELIIAVVIYDYFILSLHMQTLKSKLDEILFPFCYFKYLGQYRLDFKNWLFTFLCQTFCDLRLYLVYTDK